MDPITLAAFAAPMIGGAIGNLAGSGDRSRARELQQRALDEILKLQIPDIEKQQLAFEMLQDQGDITPEAEATLLQEASRMEGVTTDPRLREAQMSALNKLQELSTTGLGAEDRMALNDIRRSVASDDRARRESILQNMQQRGAGGAGAELATQLASSQASTDRASAEGDRVAAMAQQKALEALMKSGQLGGDIRQQEFNEKSGIAQAADAVNRFNAANRQNVLSRNVGARNRAQELNLADRQRLADSNVGLRNQEQQYNKGLIQQQYQNQLGRAQAASGAMNTSANQNMQNAQATAQMWGQIGGGLGSAALAYGANQKKQPLPEDEEKDKIYGIGGSKIGNVPSSG